MMIFHEQDSGRMLAALRAVLRDKGLVREEAVIGAAEQMAAASATRGAQMVARAWTDPAFRALMLRDGARAAASVGYSLAGAPPLGVLENAPQIQHLIVCTLCSCYPRGCLACRRSRTNRRRIARARCATRAELAGGMRNGRFPRTSVFAS